MAARYVRIGQHPDYRDEIRGTLSEILASTANPGTYAAPEDVTGTFLEMGADGLWTGASVGYLTKAQADAVLAAQATKATLKVGVPAQVDGGPVTWRGAGSGGWAPQVESINPYDIAWGYGTSVIMWGSSSTQYNTDVIDTDLPSHSLSLIDAADGYLVAANYKHSLGLYVKQNRGTAGANTSAIYAKLAADLATISDFDIAVLQLSANDMPTVDYASAALAINALLEKNKKIILVVPHAKYAITNKELQAYSDYSAWCYGWEARLPTRIVVVDHFEALGSTQVTVATGNSDDGIHLNGPGSWLAADAWRRVSRIISTSDCEPEQYGVIIAETNFSDAVLTNCVREINADGSVTLTASIAGSSPLAKKSFSGLPTDRPMRLWVDLDIVQCPSGLYAPGTRISAGANVHRHMTLNHHSGGISGSAATTGKRRYLSLPHTLSQSAITIDAFLGAGAGTSMRVRRACLIAPY